MAATRGGRRRQTTTTTFHDRRRRLISAVTSATLTAHKFLKIHDLTLLPSQTLSLHSTLASLSHSLSKKLHPPTIHPLSLSPSWFHRLLIQSSSSSSEHSLNDPRWPVFFRMSKPSFSLLLRLLTPTLSSLPVPPSAALAATLYRLAHNANYLTLSRLFSLGPSATACRVFFSVCKAIQDKLSHMFEFGSDWSNGGRVVVGFGWMSLPNCCGVLGFDRFPVDGKNLLGENGSLLVQAVVDSEGRFLDVSAGWPSTMKPDKILRHSKLFSGIETTHEYLTGDSFVLDENESEPIPQYLLGDACLPLLPWLITPYSEPGGDTEKTEFNLVHKKGMDLVETAFGRVKEKWKIVSGKWKEECIEYFPFVVVTCCLLHNYLIKCSEEFEFLEEDVEYESGRKMPVFEGGEEDGEGMRIRKALALHLNRVRLSE